MENTQFLNGVINDVNTWQEATRTVANRWRSDSNVCLGYELFQIQEMIEINEKIHKERASFLIKLQEVSSNFNPTLEDWKKRLTTGTELSHPPLFDMFNKGERASMCGCCGSGNYPEVTINGRIYFSTEGKVPKDLNYRPYNDYEEPLVLVDEETGSKITISWRDK